MSSGNAFDDVLYGSDSDIEDDEPGNDSGKLRQEEKPSGAKPTRAREVRLRVDDDNPMDLLTGTSGNISSAYLVRKKTQQNETGAH